MNSKLSLALSESLVTRVRSWLDKLAPLAFARYLITFFMGVAAILACNPAAMRREKK